MFYIISFDNVNKIIYITTVKTKNPNHLFCIFILMLMLLDHQEAASISQNKIQYEYDAAGNRISRKYVISTFKKPPLQQFSDSVYTEQIPEEQHISIYPNPTKDILSVGISGVSEECTINLSLYDSQGALLQNITASPEESPIKINMASYLANWYILKVSIKEKNKFFKIIKQ